MLIISFASLLAVVDASECMINAIQSISQTSEANGVIGKSGVLLLSYNGCDTSGFAVNIMPKRSRQSSNQSKKSRHINLASNKRDYIPRNCKTKTRFDDFDELLNFIPTYNLMGSSRPNFESKVESTSKKKEDVKESASGDELDVVFDIQEEKKNKIYEVITVMSDDETPNQVSYERIYADDPEKRKVDESEVPLEILQKSTQDLKQKQTEVEKDPKSNGLIKHTDSIPANDNAPRRSNEEGQSSNPNKKTPNILIDDSDSDSVVCVAVIDSKTKAAEKKSNVEEVCLSSDSESSSYLPKLPPIKLKLSSSDYPSLSSYTSAQSLWPMDRRISYSNPWYSRPQLCPFKPWLSSKPASEFEPFSNSSSDDLQLTSSNSAKAESEESSNSNISGIASNHRNKTDLNERSESSSSTNFSSSDEEIEDVKKEVIRSKNDVRYEEFTDFGRKVHKGETEIDAGKNFRFKVMSYNVLAQTLLDQHMYLYSNNDKRALPWVQRWNLIYNEIKDEDPDVLCLQEVQHNHILTHYNKLCELGYSYIYKKRTGRYMDGVAVFFKTSLFTEERIAKVEYYQPGIPVLDRDNVGVVIRLRLKQSPENAIVIATTHLLYNPKRSDIKLAQTQLLLAEIDRIAYNNESKTYYPVIVTGDFNLEPRSGVYKMITEGDITYEGASRKTLLPEGKKHILTKTLLPCSLGITDHCQHVDVLEARLRGEEVLLSKRIYNSELNQEPDQIACEQDDATDIRFGSGRLHHGLKFLSAYPHIQASGEPEASTHHDSWVTVDYVFYSSPKEEKEESTEERLKLLSRLRLPTEYELARFIVRLPNMDHGSDHLPLVCKFLMKLN